MRALPRLCAAILLCACLNAKAESLLDEATIRITIHPKKIEQPELRYRLMPAATDRTPGNAAQAYLLAFGQPIEGLGFSEFNDMVSAGTSEFPLEKARMFVVRGDAAMALAYLEIASRRENCIWDLADRDPWLESQSTNFIGARAQWHAGIISLSARVALVDRHFDKASHSLQAGFALGSNLSNGTSLYQSMNGMFVDSLMDANVLRWAQTADAPNLYWPLVNLPPHTQNFRKAMEHETSMLQRSFPGLEHPESLSADESRRLLHNIAMKIGQTNDAEMIVAMMRDYPQTKRHLVESGVLTSEAAESMPANSLMLMWYYQEYLRAADTLSKYLGLPVWQGAVGAVHTFERILHPDRPYNLLILTLPHYPDAIARFASADRRTNMLVTLEALRAFAADHAGTLPDSLDQLSPQTPAPIDPVTGKSFSYQKTAEAATLSAPTVEYSRLIKATTWQIVVAR